MTDQEHPVEERNELLDDLLTAATNVAVDEQDQSQTVVAPDRRPGARLLDERADAPECITARGKHCGVRPFELSFHVGPWTSSLASCSGYTHIGTGAQRVSRYYIDRRRWGSPPGGSACHIDPQCPSFPSS